MSEDQLLGVQNHPIQSFTIGWFFHTNGKSSRCLGYQGIVAVNQSLQKSDPFTSVNHFCLAPKLPRSYGTKIGHFYLYSRTKLVLIQNRNEGTAHTGICQSVDNRTMYDPVWVKKRGGDVNVAKAPPLTPFGKMKPQ